MDTDHDAKLTRRNHPSPEAARWELVKHGYYPMHIGPQDAQEKWRRLDKKHPVLTIGREDRPRSKVWHIVEANCD